MLLPTHRVATDKDPRVLTLMSTVKVGKTSAAMQLPKSLLLDFENSSGYFDGTAINMIKVAQQENTGLGSLLLSVADAIKTANQEIDGYKYDFIIIDTLTAIEAIAKLKATHDYKKSLVGKNFNGTDVVSELPKGAGYMWYNNAFNDLIEPFKKLAGKCLILMGHTKLATITKGATEVDSKDIELSGKNRLSVTAKVDSVGMLYRNPKNKYQNIVTFRKTQEDAICGSRSAHLSGKAFIFSDYDSNTDTLTTKWDQIFTSLQSSSTEQMSVVDDSELDPIIEEVEG